jgi:hypothetical protein
MDFDYRRPVHQGFDAQLLAIKKNANELNIEKLTVTPSPELVIEKSIPRRIPSPLDFENNARLYRKKLRVDRWAKRVSHAFYAVSALLVLLGALGIYVNHKYQGKALPYSYVGSISVGGMSESEIINLLQKQNDQMHISFTDGGLTTTVPVGKLGLDYNLSELAQQITHHRFNPFYYLSIHHFSANPVFRGSALDSFLKMYVNNTKTAPQNATLIKTKTGLAIQSEMQGFQANADYLSKEILAQSADLSSPTINVNTVSTNPQVYSSDLKDELGRANSLLDTRIVIKYKTISIIPTRAEKLAWMQINPIPGDVHNLSITFLSTQVREYVLAQANKFQQHINSASNQNGTIVATYRGMVIDNIDSATNQIVADLNNGNPAEVTLTSSQQTYDTLTH